MLPSILQPLLLLSFGEVVQGLDNGLARTPPMGWMSWQRFRCQTDCVTYPNDCISEALMLRTADKLVKDGYREVGYRYLIVDDCWQEKQRDPMTQKIVADRKRFPHVSWVYLTWWINNVWRCVNKQLFWLGQGLPGIHTTKYCIHPLPQGLQYLGKQLHSRGLLFGVYLDYGTLTCEGFPGSMDHLALDAHSLLEWGADYTKMDGCYSPENKMAPGYEEFSRLLNATGRPIVFSCSYPAYVDWFNNATRIDWQRLQRNCNLWRMYADVQDSWQSLLSIIALYEQRGELLRTVAGPGHWNDPDMLLLGNYGLSSDQQRVQMGMWCMLAAPLIISADMDSVDADSADLLKNTLLIQINQDAGGHQAQFVKTKNYLKLWTRQLTFRPTSSWAISLINPIGGGGPIRTTVKLSEFNVKDQGESPSLTKFTLTNVFTGAREKTLSADELFDVWVRPTGIEMFLIEQETR